MADRDMPADEITPQGVGEAIEQVPMQVDDDLPPHLFSNRVQFPSASHEVTHLARASLRKKSPVVYHEIDGPTLERKRHAHGAYEITGEDRASQKYTMLDTPLARLRARGGLDAAEHEALRRYGEHFYQGGLLGSVGSINLNSVFSSPFCRDHMAKTEGQVDHRLEYQRARELLRHARPAFHSKFRPENFGHKLTIVVDNVVCGEWELHIAGHSIGYSSPYRGRTAVAEMLKEAGYRLARLWGIG